MAAALLALVTLAGCSDQPRAVKGGTSSGLVFARVVNGGVDLARARLADGAVAPLLTTPDRDESWPYWSELARRLVFEVGPINGRSPSDLHVWVPITGEEYPITQTPQRSERWAAWAPNTPSLAFAFLGGGAGSGIAVSDLESVGAQVVARARPGEPFLRPAWAPDGRHLVAQRRGEGGSGSHLWIVSFDEPPRQITDDVEWLDIKAWFTRSADRIVYTRRPPQGGWYEVVSIAPDGSDERVLFPVEEADTHSARPSPTRDELALVSDREGRFDLYLGSLDSEEIRNVSNTPDEDEFAPRWSPDGELLVVTVSEAGEGGVPRLDDVGSLEDARIRVLDRRGEVLFETPGFMPDWMPAW